MFPSLVVHIQYTPHYYLKIRFKNIFPSKSKSGRLDISVKTFRQKYSVRISHFYHACHMPFPSHPPWFYQLHAIWKRTKITKFPHYATSLFPCSFPFPSPHFVLSALSMAVFCILLAWNSTPKYWTIQFLPCSKDTVSTLRRLADHYSIARQWLFILTILRST